jgi:hypothetical protein
VIIIFFVCIRKVCFGASRQQGNESGLKYTTILPRGKAAAEIKFLRSPIEGTTFAKTTKMDGFEIHGTRKF